MILIGLGFAAAALIYSFFVLAAHAIARSRSSRLEEHELSGVVGSKLARLVLERADFYLFAAQAGSYLAAVAAVALLVVLAGRGGWAAAGSAPGGWGPVGQAAAAAALLVVVAAGASVYVQLLKALAYSHPARVLCYLSIPLVVTANLFDPLVRLLIGLVKTLVHCVGLAMPADREAAASPEEISQIVAESSEAGKLEENEGEMIKGVIQFSDLEVREVMTPRKDVAVLEETASLSQVVTEFTTEGFSRLLVVGSGLDDVKGVLMAKDLIPWVGRSAADFSVRRVMREAYSVPNTKRVGELLQEFRRAGIHLAVVLDEHGGVDGVVTIEDLIEEIVGDILDEYDQREEEASFRPTQSGDLVVKGSAALEDLNQAYPLKLPPGDYETVAGFVINYLGRIPVSGESVEYNGIRLKIERVAENRIVRLRILRGAQLAPSVQEET